MSCYKIDNIIDVPANGDCMFESIWNSLDDQLREVITKEVYDIIQKQEDKEMGMNAYLEEGKEYRYLRILCHYNEHLYGEQFGVSNISNLRDKNVPDADKKIFDLNGQERWGDSPEIFIITSFLKKKKHNIHIQVYEKEKERDCYRLNDFGEIVDEKVDKEIYLIYVGGNHYKYTLSKPEKVDVEKDAIEKVDVGDVAVVGEGDVKQSKGTNVAPMIVLSIFVLFMASVSG